MAKILIVDDEKSIRSALKDILEFEGYELDEAENGEIALKKIEEDNYDVVLCDIKMPKVDGLEVLERGLALKPDTQFVMISGHSNIDTAVEATKKGAYDFLQKPPDLNRLLITLRNALDKNTLVEQTKVLKRKVSKTQEIIGDSPAIEKIKQTIEKIAPTEARVLITGSNGTGKELVARWIHEKSNRYKGNFIAVNCAAIPSELIESELFGHEKGAFTSAIKMRIGKFEKANGGTLFLDEIGDMSMDAQAKVLRALQENKIVRVGGEKEIAVDVRVIAATNKNLFDEIEKSKFREDLYHRLSVILIHSPALKDRKEDIGTLSEYFLDQICKEYNYAQPKITAKAIKALETLEWTGNIRELRNVIERLLILSGDEITEEDVLSFASPRTSSKNSTSNNPQNNNLFQQFETLQEFKDFAEKEFIDKKLKKFAWNITKTAQILNIQRSHLYNKIERHQLKRDEE